MEYFFSVPRREDEKICEIACFFTVFQERNNNVHTVFNHMLLEIFFVCLEKQINQYSLDRRWCLKGTV